MSQFHQNIHKVDNNYDFGEALSLLLPKRQNPTIDNVCVIAKTPLSGLHVIVCINACEVGMKPVCCTEAGPLQHTTTTKLNAAYDVLFLNVFMPYCCRLKYSRQLVTTLPQRGWRQMARVLRATL